MLPQFNIKVSAEKLPHFRQALQSLLINGHPAKFSESDNGFFSLSFGQANLHLKELALQFEGRAVAVEELGMRNVEIDDKSGTSAYHIPHGCLFVYDPLARPEDHERTQISTLDVAPTILRNFSVPVPEYMKHTVSV